MKIATGHKVRIEFELRVKGGDKIEHSTVEYIQGEGKIPPAIEAPGGPSHRPREDRRHPSQRSDHRSFAAHQRDPAQRVSQGGQARGRSDLRCQGPDGSPISFKVVKADKDKITVRFLHPLLGKDLSFKVTVLMIEDPKAKARRCRCRPAGCRAGH